MNRLTRDDLYTLEKYAEMRAEFRANVIAHKKNRNVRIGPSAALYFEDRMTIQYQVQEMLRVERIFEAAGIREELEAYNPLIPDGHNWKATFMLEFDDPAERAQRLAELVDIEHKVWLQVEGFDRVHPICDEDLDRATEDKTSSVHFMRFELSPSMVAAMTSGAELQAGIDHPGLSIPAFTVDTAIRDSLSADLELVTLN